MDSMWALTFDRTRESWDDSRGMVRERVEVPSFDPSEDRDMALVRIRYAGFCGSDRGIWWRKAFGEMVADSLDDEKRERRIFGHEFLGDVIAVGADVERVAVGDVVAAESHVVCEECLQCRLGQKHVCANDHIIGISMDGAFADVVKLPAKILWPTDLSKIRPEVAAVQEPFGNAVHACQAVDLKGKRVAILGTGTIGLFAVLIAKGMGAKQVIGIEPDPHNAELARRLGCDAVLTPGRPPQDKPWASDPELVAQVREMTEGRGVDVCMEMSGFNSSVNNAVRLTRRGGDIVLFGVKDGNFVFEDAHHIVMDGLTLHGIVGRQIFGTWEITKALLEDKSNGIQDKVWEVILNRGEDTLVDIGEFDPTTFELAMARHPKLILKFS